MFKEFIIINNNNDNEDEQSTKLFFTIWRDQNINKEIFKQSRLYSDNYSRKFTSIQSLKQDPYRNYIKKLELDKCDENTIIDIGLIPSTTIELNFLQDFRGKLTIGSIPSSVKTLSFGKNFTSKLAIGAIPSSVLKLDIGFDIHNTYIYVKPTKQLPTPNNKPPFMGMINSMDNMVKVEYPIGLIPDSVIDLSLTGEFLLHDIPKSVKNLTVSLGNNITIGTHNLPTTIESLTFLRDGLLQTLNDNTFPNQIQTLDVGRYFNQTIQSSHLPSSLVSLTLGQFYNMPLQSNSIPPLLEHIEFGYKFNHPITSDIIIPNSLKSIKLSIVYKYYQETNEYLSQINFKRNDQYFIRD